jgi:hypothetical protein
VKYTTWCVGLSHVEQSSRVGEREVNGQERKSMDEELGSTKVLAQEKRFWPQLHLFSQSHLPLLPPTTRILAKHNQKWQIQSSLKRRTT